MGHHVSRRSPPCVLLCTARVVSAPFPETALCAQAAAAEYERKQQDERQRSSAKGGRVARGRQGDFSAEQAAQLDAAAAAHQRSTQPGAGAGAGGGAGGGGSKYTQSSGIVSQVYLDPNPARPSLVVSIGGRTGRMQTVRLFPCLCGSPSVGGGGVLSSSSACLQLRAHDQLTRPLFGLAGGATLASMFKSKQVCA